MLNALFASQLDFFPFSQRELLEILGRFAIAPMDLHHGITLQQCGRLVEAAVTVRNGLPFVAVELVQLDNDAALLERLRKDLDSLHGRRFMLANFYRVVEDHYGGHFSPISCFSGANAELLVPLDFVLVLDVNPSRLLPHWLPLPFLSQMMARIDKRAELPRGYLILTLLDDEG